MQCTVSRNGWTVSFREDCESTVSVFYHNSLNFQRFPINEHGTVRLWTDLEIVGTGEPVCVGDWILPAWVTLREWFVMVLGTSFGNQMLANTSWGVTTRFLCDKRTPWAPEPKCYSSIKKFENLIDISWIWTGSLKKQFRFRIYQWKFEIFSLMSSTSILALTESVYRIGNAW